MIIKLEIREHDEYGVTGLIPVCMRQENVPDNGEGYQIAHDIVEHVNGLGAIGGIEDELEALGAIWLCRGMHADIRRPNRSIYSPEANVASDVSSLFGYWNGRKLKFSNTHSHDCDDSFDYIIEEAQREIRDMNYGKNIDYWNTAAKKLMRSGARKLVRRFRAHRHPEYAANTLFYNIQGVCRMVSTPYEGQTFDLVLTGTNAKLIETTRDYYDEF